MASPILNDARDANRVEQARCCRCLNNFPASREPTPYRKESTPVPVREGVASPEGSSGRASYATELHHVFCRRTDKRHTIRLCPCCHMVLTAQQRMLGVDFATPTDLLRGIANVMLGIAATLEMFLAWRDLLVTLAERLRAIAVWLDETLPGWREHRQAAWPIP